MPEWVVQLLIAGALYGGIRADLRHAMTCANEAKGSATEAHKRIDDILVKGQYHG